MTRVHIEVRPQAHVLGLLGLLAIPSVESTFITTRQGAKRLGVWGARGGGTGTFPEQVDVAVCEQHVQQLQCALHVPRAHPNHLRARSRQVRHCGCRPARAARCPPEQARARPASPCSWLSRVLQFLGLTLKSCSSFSRNTWIISRSK